MPDASTVVDVAIVGGGPVGVALAALLARRGIEVAVFEARATPHRHSRAIGIHPTALDALAALGVDAELRAAGHAVRRGRALRAADGAAHPLGALDFALCPGPHRYVLTLPQHRTEAILAARLAELAPGALRRDHRVVGVAPGADAVDLVVDGPEGRRRWRAAALVACDGAGGATRARLGIDLRAARYPDSFAMGDFADPFPAAERDAAAIYLTPRGVVEAFPLPGGGRRWVLATGTRLEDPSPAFLTREVARRTGARLDPATCTMRSSFGAERRLAARFAVGRAALCGDAAHVCSPIGGQGMNLGWLDAAALVAPLERLLAGDAPPGDPLGVWARRRRRAARGAIRRAELNMALGRPWRFGGVRELLVRAALQRPLADGAARLFTMRGLA